MKSMARAILFGGIIVATGAAVADMVSSAMGETDKDMAASSMPAEPQAGEPTAGTEAAVPGSTEGAAQDVAASGTSAEPQANESMTTAAATTPTAPPVTVATPLPPRQAGTWWRAFLPRFRARSTTRATVFWRGLPMQIGAVVLP